MVPEPAEIHAMATQLLGLEYNLRMSVQSIMGFVTEIIKDWGDYQRDICTLEMFGGGYISKAVSTHVDRTATNDTLDVSTRSAWCDG